MILAWKKRVEQAVPLVYLLSGQVKDSVHFLCGTITHQSSLKDRTSFGIYSSKRLTSKVTWYVPTISTQDSSSKPQNINELSLSLISPYIQSNYRTSNTLVRHTQFSESPSSKLSPPIFQFNVSKSVRNQSIHRQCLRPELSGGYLPLFPLHWGISGCDFAREKVWRSCIDNFLWV